MYWKAAELRLKRTDSLVHWLWKSLSLSLKGLRTILQGFCTSSEEICISMGLFEHSWSRTWNTTHETKENNKLKNVCVMTLNYIYSKSFSFSCPSLICWRTHTNLLLLSSPPQTLAVNSSKGHQPIHSQSSSSAGAHGLGGDTFTRFLSPEEI